MQEGPEAPEVSLFRLAALGAGGPPGALEGVDVALPSAAGADAVPHLFLEAGGHGLLGLVGEVDRVPSFINAIGYPRFYPFVWEIVKRNLDGSLVVSLREVCDAIRLMAERNKVIVEGAGAVSVAAALSGKAGSGKVACVVSGGNIDLDRLVTIIHGKIPKKI